MPVPVSIHTLLCGGAARCGKGQQRGARLVGAIGACTHRPPVRSLTTVMRTVVDTLMPASDCGAQRVCLSSQLRGVHEHATIRPHYIWVCALRLESRENGDVNQQTAEACLRVLSWRQQEQRLVCTQHTGTHDRTAPTRGPARGRVLWAAPAPAQKPI